MKISKSAFYGAKQWGKQANFLGSRGIPHSHTRGNPDSFSRRVITKVFRYFDKMFFYFPLQEEALLALKNQESDDANSRN